jgi:CRP-like cAMP-binding protein
MSEHTTLTQLSKIPILQGFSNRQLQSLITHAIEEKIKPNTVIIQEKKTVKNFYIILSGHLTILTSDQNNEMILSTLGPGDFCGESQLMQEKTTANATVKATSKTTLLKLPLSYLISSPDILLQLKANLSQHLLARISRTNSLALHKSLLHLHEYKKRSQIGHFLINLNFILIIYIVFLNINNTPTLKNTPTSSMLGLGMLFFICLLLIRQLQTIHIPIQRCGISLNISKSSILQALLFSVFFICLTSSLKIFYLFETGVSQNGLFHDFFELYPLYNASGVYQSFLIYMLNILLYFSSVIMQEFVIRGCTQGIIQQFYNDNNELHKWKAIFFANIIFTIFHIHTISYIIPVFVFGLFLGWFYHKTKNLIPVIMVHFVVACWVFFIMGFPFLYKNYNL